VNPKTVLFPLPTTDFDPTEVAVPWKMLESAGVKTVFATPNGHRPSADPIMLSGRGLGLLKSALMAQPIARKAYSALLQTEGFQKPRSYAEISSGAYDGVILAGGHASGMKPYLESSVLQKWVADFAQTGRPVGAICHGVVLAARSGILKNRRTTALPKWMELSAWGMTRLWMGSYYRTYPETVEDEVKSALSDASQFECGPMSLVRDSEKNLDSGFTVRDGNYLSARWPGDAHRFGRDFLEMLK